MLEKNWAHKIWDTIISSKQHNQSFIDWKIKIENLNSILATSSPTHALTEARLKVQLEANLNKKLKLNIHNEPVLSSNLAAWSIEVKECDNCLKAEDACTLKLIEANAATCATKRTERQDLLSRLSDTLHNAKATAQDSTDSKHCNLPKLLPNEKQLLNIYDGCT